MREQKLVLLIKLLIFSYFICHDGHVILVSKSAIGPGPAFFWINFGICLDRGLDLDQGFTINETIKKKRI